MSKNTIATGNHWVSSDYVVYLRDFALSKGISAKTLLEGSDANLQLLLEPPEQVSEQIFQQMATNMFDALDAPYAGVVDFGKGMILSLHGSLGVAIQGASDLFEVAKLTEKYYQTRASARTVQLIKEASYFCLRHSEAGGGSDAYIALATLISFDYVVEALLNHHHLTENCVIHQIMDEPENFPWQLLQGYRIEFGQTHNQIMLPQKWMNLPIKSIDPELAKLAKKRCEQALQTLSTLDLVGEIRQRLKISQHNSLGLKQMAQLLHVSPSTLQRRLRELGTTFKQIKLHQRLSDAKQLLLNQHFTLEQISEQLGFCDASSFTKSFKNFTGHTPSAYRQR